MQTHDGIISFNFLAHVCMEKFSLKRVGPIVNLLVLVLQLVGFSILESACCRALSVLKRGANLINFAMPKSGKSWRVSLSNFLSVGNRFAFWNMAAAG